MRACELSVVLDRRNRTYAIGEEITGSIRVHVNSECRPRDLSLGYYWRTHGRGNAVRSDVSSALLFRGRWLPGLHSYPFAVQALPGPLTYHGKYLNVDWYLTAQANIRWLFNPKAEEEVLLVPGAPGQTRDLGPNYLAPADVVGGTTSLRNRPAQMRLGTVACRVTPRVVQPGEVVSCELSFTPQTGLEVTDVTATLTGKEIVTSGSGTSTATYVHQFHLNEVSFGYQRRLAAGEAVTFRGRMPVPANAPATFVARDNALRWLVKLQIKVRGWPGWSTEMPIAVKP